MDEKLIENKSITTIATKEIMQEITLYAVFDIFLSISMPANNISTETPILIPKLSISIIFLPTVFKGSLSLLL